MRFTSPTAARGARYKRSAILERAELIAGVEARRAPRRRWFLTERGAELALNAGEMVDRPKILSPEQAAGPLAAHTLDVNEVGNRLPAGSKGARRGIRAAQLAARTRPFTQPRPRPRSGRKLIARFGIHLCTKPGPRLGSRAALP